MDSPAINTQNTLRPWFICGVASLFFFYEFIQMNMMGSISQDLMGAYHIDAVTLSLLSSTYFIANAIFLFPAGILLDRYSTKKIIVIAMFLCAAGTGLFALTSNFWLALVFRFMTGIGSAFCFLSCFRLASRWFPAKRMALVTGLIVTMAMLGGAVAQNPLTELTLAVGWRAALLWDAGLGFLILGLIFVIVRDHPEGYDWAAERAQNELQHVSFWVCLRKTYFKIQNVLAAIYTSLLNLPVAILGAFAGSIYLTQVHGFTRDQASFINGMIFIGTIFGGPLIGYLSDRFARRRMPMIGGAILSLAVMLIIIYIPFNGMWPYVGLFFLLGFFTSTQVLSYPTVAESNPLALAATAVSIISLMAQGGTGVYQYVFSRVLQLTPSIGTINHAPIYAASSYQEAILIIPVGFAIAIVIASLIKETYGARQKTKDASGTKAQYRTPVFAH